MLQTLWAVTKNSFIEIIRQPVYAILLVGGMALIAFSPAITMFSMVEDEKLMVDMGLATIMLLGVVMAVLSSTQVITREIETQTVGAIVSKPVGRFSFVLSKFLAVTLGMALSSYLLSLVLLMALRMGVPSEATYRMDWPALLAELMPFFLAIALGIYCNYFYRWNFTSTAVIAAVPLYTVAFGLLMVVGPNWNIELVPSVFAERFAGQVARAAGLVFLGVWSLSSLAVALSTRLNVVPNAIICLATFFVGMIAQFLAGQLQAPLMHPWLAAGASALAWVITRFVPNLYVFWVGDQLMAEVPYVPFSYVWAAAGYAAAFSAAMVMVAAFLFERREVI